MIPIVVFPGVFSGLDEMADNYYPFPYYNGLSSSPVGVGGSIGVNDNDTVKLLQHPTDIIEGSVASLHLDDDFTAYQNLSGKNATAVIILTCRGTGTSERHVKVWSSPTVDSTSSATLIFEFGATTNNFMNASAESLTVICAKIQNNHYLTIENIDDLRAGTNSIEVSNTSFVVERGS